MSALKHTPGPWKINADCPMAEHGRISIETDDYYIALLDAGARQAANARLIAAVPDLLKVLRMARAKIAAELQVMAMCHTGPDGLIDDAEVVLLIEAEQDLINQIDEAITKATGEQA